MYYALPYLPALYHDSLLNQVIVVKQVPFGVLAFCKEGILRQDLYTQRHATEVLPQ